MDKWLGISNKSKNIIKLKNNSIDNEKSHFQINGLLYFDNFLTKEEEKMLLEKIDDLTWSENLKRRVQHYGYEYDYNSKKINTNKKINELPEFTDFIIKKIRELKIIDDFSPNQLIINEYLPGQGINSHIDKIKEFKDGIVSISLGSDINMEFTKEKITKIMRLKTRSILILTHDARYLWEHGIKPRKNDIFEGKIIKRRKRISLTFRRIINS